MKQSTMMAFLFSAIMSIVFVISCKHEIPGAPCVNEPIQLALNKTDAIGTLNNGTITATATGGADFLYSLNGSSFQNNGTFTGLQPFLTYNVVVKNAWGCTDTAQIAIGVSNPCAGVTVSVTAVKTNASPNMSNGTITATAVGGAGFTYSLDGVVFQSSNVFNGLAAGDYTITAKNAIGCTGVVQITVGSTDPCTGVTITVAATKVDPTAGQPNGSITVTATGGTGFTYSLNSGAYQPAATFSGLVTGNYTVSAKSSNGCIGSVAISLGSTNPCNGVVITVTTTKTDPVTGQSNGTITATATGGTGFSYSLNNGAYQTSATFTGLAAGNYTITAKSAAGCLGTSSVTLTNTSPCTSTNIVLSAATVNYTPCVTPNSGTITITATGSSGFTYNINGGAYQVSNIFSGLAAANYTIGVKDLNGCTKTASSIVSTTAMGPLFTGMRSLISTRCNGSGCHIGAGNAAKGYNFDNNCSIVNWWSQINRTCITYTLARMPINPQPTLTVAEKAIITNWINAGHRYTD
jgi:hypothetical protein